MHILIIPSFYPEKNTPVNGLFFKNQSKVLLHKVGKIGTVYTEQKSLKKVFSGINENLYQLTKEKEDGLLTYRIRGINLLNQYPLGSAIWIKVTLSLVKKYIAENGKPDIIHAHNVFHAGRVAMACFKKHQIPYVITEHDSAYLLNDYTAEKLKIATRVLKSSAGNIAVSKNLATAIAKSCNVSPLQVIPNVVNLGLFQLDFSNRKEDQFKVISVGNLLKNKGHHILIQAFKIFKDTGVNAALEIYGEGPEFENLSQLILDLDLSDCVTLKGKISPHNLVGCYQTSHCLVLPSFRETFGVVIIEAMACGLPVIATKSGGPEDIIIPGTGILIESGDILKMAASLSELHRNYSAFDPAEIRKFIERNYSEDVVADQLLSLYRAVENSANVEKK
ncbi:glycosyltransferase [Pedobacter gandavensis]|uniref:glycosyltransferase n=1 Tax=Pedobacter gandavensis TaxID=2679963 RepID=UPI00292FC861|nr:glycosyltransferase [Pedobacter gandavensis]